MASSNCINFYLGLEVAAFSFFSSSSANTTFSLARVDVFNLLLVSCASSLIDFPRVPVEVLCHLLSNSASINSNFSLVPNGFFSVFKGYCFLTYFCLRLYLALCSGNTFSTRVLVVGEYGRCHNYSFII